MSGLFQGTSVGEAHVTQILSEFPETVRQELLSATQVLTGELKSAVIAEIEAETTTHTGELLASVKEKVYDNPESVKGMVVSTAGAQAVALEYGAHGTGKVKAHSQGLNHLWSEPISEIIVDVSEYERTQNIAVHSFIRPALAGMEEKVNATYAAALEKAAETAQGALDAGS